jgi:hypothetical protein
MSDRTAIDGIRGGAVLTWALMLIAPLLGYAFLSSPLRRQPVLEPSTRRLVVGLCWLYWLAYIPGLYVLAAVNGLGRAGGI